jgi:hypothetical protein
MNNAPVAIADAGPNAGKCGVCGKDVHIRKPKLMMGPNGYRRYDACLNCISASNPPTGTATKLNFPGHKYAN